MGWELGIIYAMTVCENEMVALQEEGTNVWLSV